MSSIEVFDSLPHGAFVRLPVVLAVLGISRSTFYAGIQSGIYPRPVKVGTRASAWRKSEILDLQNRLAAARA